MWLGLNNWRRVLKLGCFYYCSYYDIIACMYLIPKGTSQFLVQLVLVISFFKINLISHLISHDSQCTPPNYLLSNLLHSWLPTEVVYVLQASIIFILLKHEEHKSSRSSCHFAPKNQNKLFAHDKNRKHAELWVRTNLYNYNNVFVMYALVLAHVKVRCMKRSWSFAVLFDKPGWIERQVDRNTNLPNLIDSNVELYMCRI